MSKLSRLEKKLNKIRREEEKLKDLIRKETAKEEDKKLTRDYKEKHRQWKIEDRRCKKEFRQNERMLRSMGAI